MNMLTIPAAMSNASFRMTFPPRMLFLIVYMGVMTQQNR
jgi:hypothetical protein